MILTVLLSYPSDSGSTQPVSEKHKQKLKVYNTIAPNRSKKNLLKIRKCHNFTSQRKTAAIIQDIVDKELLDKCHKKRRSCKKINQQRQKRRKKQSASRFVSKRYEN